MENKYINELTEKEIIEFFNYFNKERNVFLQAQKNENYTLWPPVGNVLCQQCSVVIENVPYYIVTLLDENANFISFALISDFDIKFNIDEITLKGRTTLVKFNDQIINFSRFLHAFLATRFGKNYVNDLYDYEVQRIQENASTLEGILAMVMFPEDDMPEINDDKNFRLIRKMIAINQALLVQEKSPNGPSVYDEDTIKYLIINRVQGFIKGKTEIQLKALDEEREYLNGLTDISLS